MFNDYMGDFIFSTKFVSLSYRKLAKKPWIFIYLFSFELKI